jgi:hypothetical protein
MLWCHRRALLAFASALLVPITLSAQGRSPAALARLADSVQAAGGRVIVILKSTSKAAGMAQPGAPPLGSAELDSVQIRIETAPGMSVTGKAAQFGAIFATATSAGLGMLNSDPNVVSIEADVFMPLQSERSLDEIYRPNRVVQSTPWGITQVTAPQSWPMVNGGAGVKVGILDSGGDATHEDLSYAGGYNATTGSTATADWNDDLVPCNGHGTSPGPSRPKTMGLAWSVWHPTCCSTPSKPMWSSATPAAPITRR